MTQAFCMKEKRMVDIQNEQVVLTKNNLRRATGTCTCGMKLSRILGKPA